MGPTMRFLVRASYLQIYNECISDLLKPKRNNLAIRESKRRGLYVEGLSEWVVKSPQEIFGNQNKSLYKSPLPLDNPFLIQEDLIPEGVRKDRSNQFDFIKQNDYFMMF